MEKFVAIYVRRSVSDKDKGNNSLSIASQKADCLKELKKGEKYRIYCDDGKSGKDIAHRPENPVSAALVPYASATLLAIVSRSNSAKLSKLLRINRPSFVSVLNGSVNEITLTP